MIIIFQCKPLLVISKILTYVFFLLFFIMTSAHGGVCDQHSSKSYEWILIIITGNVETRDD